MTHDMSPVNAKIEAERLNIFEDANLNDFVQKKTEKFILEIFQNDKFSNYRKWPMGFKRNFKQF